MGLSGLGQTAFVVLAENLFDFFFTVREQYSEWAVF